MLGNGEEQIKFSDEISGNRSGVGGGHHGEMLGLGFGGGAETQELGVSAGAWSARGVGGKTTSDGLLAEWAGQMDDREEDPKMGLDGMAGGGGAGGLRRGGLARLVGGGGARSRTGDVKGAEPGLLLNTAFAEDEATEGKADAISGMGQDGVGLATPPFTPEAPNRGDGWLDGLLTKVKGKNIEKEDSELLSITEVDFGRICGATVGRDAVILQIAKNSRTKYCPKELYLFAIFFCSAELWEISPDCCIARLTACTGFRSPSPSSNCCRCNYIMVI